MIPFSKLHGAGNDFIVLDGLASVLPDYSALALAMCDRHFGVGGDGIMVALPSDIADIRMVYYNSDGSEGEMCGNGIRCFSKFVYTKGLIADTHFKVETLAGIKEITLDLIWKNLVKVDMGMPLLEPEAVPTTLRGFPAELEVDGKTFSVFCMRVGVPHCVIFAEEPDTVDVNGIGQKIECHPAFPEKTNVNFVKVISPDRIRVKTWERGAGRTLACGTGCCASVVAGFLTDRVEAAVAVEAEGGLVQVQIIPEDEYRLWMTGGAEIICEGYFYFNA